VAALLHAWRASERPVIIFATIPRSRASHYRPRQPGNEFKPEAQPLPGETVIAKRTNSAFIGTDLEARLRAARQSVLVIAGVITNNSVEATVRMAGNLGFNTFLVEDGCFTFARKDFAGRLRPAAEVHAMSLANLDGEYCMVTRTADVLAALGTGRQAPSGGIAWQLLECLLDTGGYATPRRTIHFGADISGMTPGKNGAARFFGAGGFVRAVRSGLQTRWSR